MVTNWKPSRRKCGGRDWSHHQVTQTWNYIERTNLFILTCTMIPYLLNIESFFTYSWQTLENVFLFLYFSLSLCKRNWSPEFMVREREGLLICRGNIFKEEMFDWSLKRLGKRMIRKRQVVLFSSRIISQVKCDFTEKRRRGSGEREAPFALSWLSSFVASLLILCVPSQHSVLFVNLHSSPFSFNSNLLIYPTVLLSQFLAPSQNVSEWGFWKQSREFTLSFSAGEQIETEERMERMRKGGEIWWWRGKESKCISTFPLLFLSLSLSLSNSKRSRNHTSWDDDWIRVVRGSRVHFMKSDQQEIRQRERMRKNESLSEMEGGKVREWSVN